MLRWVARVALVVILSMCVAGSAMAAGEPWRDASQPPGQRADELLAAMTPDQKVAMALGDYASLASLGVPTLPSDEASAGMWISGLAWGFAIFIVLLLAVTMAWARLHGVAL